MTTTPNPTRSAMAARLLLAAEMERDYSVTAGRLRDESWADDRFPLSTQAAIRALTSASATTPQLSTRPAESVAHGGEPVAPKGDIIESLEQIIEARYTLKYSQLPADVRGVLAMAITALSTPTPATGTGSGGEAA